jgi:hypothetical protein
MSLAAWQHHFHTMEFTKTLVIKDFFKADGDGCDEEHNYLISLIIFETKISQMLIVCFHRQMIHQKWKHVRKKYTEHSN